MSLTAVAITVSTRASAGVYEDRSGPVVVHALQELGFTVGDPVVVSDGAPVGEALLAAIAAKHAVAITTGGTGLNPHDHTPEQTRAVLAYEIPQIPVAIARHGQGLGVPTAILSRGLAGVAGRTVIINLPGSRGGARDGMTVLSDVLLHAVSQVRGGDH